MGQSNAIRAGRAFVELFGDDTKLARTLRAWEGKLKNWGGKASSIGRTVFAAGAAPLAPLTAATALFSQMGSDLNDMAGRTGASVEALSTLGFAAGQAGAEIGDLEVGIKKGEKAISAAARGDAAAAKSLGRLGLAASDLINLAPEDQFRAIAKRMADIENPADRAAAAMEIFGKSGTGLLPMIAELGELEQQARDLGVEMSTADANAADAFGDSLSALWAQAKAATFQIGAALAPALQDATAWLSNAAGAAIRWVKENREMVVTVAAVAGSVALAGAAIIGLGTALSIAGAALGALVTIIGAIGTAVAAAGSVIAALVSPIGITVVALAGLTAWFLTSTETGQEALAFLGQAFNTLKTDALAAFQGIKDALAAGDLALAAKVLWTGLKVVWLEGTTFLNTHWQNFLTSMVQAGTQVAKRVADVFIDMASGVAQSLLKLEGLLSKTLGTDLIDPQLRAGMQMAIPMLAAGLKPAVGGRLDSFSTSFGEESQAKIDAANSELAAARADFSKAVSDAAIAKDEANDRKLRDKNGREIDVPTLGQMTERKGIGFQDVRGKEGFGAIAQALRQTRDNHAQATAKAATKLAANSDKTTRDIRLIREGLETVGGANFAGGTDA